jgi:hypothetical protein
MKRLIAPTLPLLLLALSTAAPAAAPTIPIFEKDILPVFKAKCLSCHGADKQKADLDMRSKATMLKGGESGPALTPGAALKSLIWEKVASDKMPPGKQKLSPEEKTLVRKWIDSGAKDAGLVATVTPDDSKDRSVTDADRDFWSFRKPTRPTVPAVRDATHVRNPIDAFLLAELEKQGLSFSEEADRHVLLRRASLDLTGLPPAPRELAEFLADRAPDAYERMIDRLLASERYGERWARHWLDLAGYADSEGILDADYVRTAAWRYRDYVIHAFNKDKPYDRFLKEQIAGDELVDYWTAYRTQKELPANVIEAITATGYLRCASDTSRPDFVNIKNAPGYYYQTLDDTLKIVASSTMGLTLECAKCHSHKYDPIPQTDYYRMQAVFMSAYRPGQWVPQVQRRLPEASEAQEKEAAAHNAGIDRAVTALRKQLDDLNKQFGERRFAERLATLPEAIREDVRTALATEANKRTEVQKYLADKFQKDLRPDPRTLTNLLATAYPDYKAKADDLNGKIKTEESKRRTFPEIRAIYDLPGEAKTHLLRRGDYLNPGKEVTPGVLSVLATAKPFTWASPGKDAKTSGRRFAFADWLTQPDHPLTARVLVNRLWLLHFGEGIVTTADNFGHKGARPTHPGLLDWLATEFIARGWSVKAMHRLIVTSSAYRQASVVTAAGKRVDPENRLLWRQRLRRVEAEVLRDSVLSAAGSLNNEMYGPPVLMQRNGDEVVTPAGPQGVRRSIYLQVRRSQPLTLLQVFDQPVMETNCTRRGVSTVASQALSLLNSDFLAQQADVFAARILKEGGDNPVDHAVRLAFARPASEREQARLKAFLKEQMARYKGPDAEHRALADLCQTLFSANEFVYMD